MKVSVLFSVVLVLFVSLRAGNVAEAVKCYVCTSSSMPNCQKSFFVSLFISEATGCTCCLKTTSSSGSTSRECVTGLDSLSCAVTVGDSHACYSDLCNGSSRLRHNAAAVLALLSTVVAVLIRY